MLLLSVAHIYNETKFQLEICAKENITFPLSSL